MKAYLQTTANLGDFLNCMPVMSGIVKSKNELMTLVIRKEMRKFNGMIDFLMYQGIFDEVFFDDDVYMYGNVIILSSWYREDKNNPLRPTETCRYENFVKDQYKIDFEVDDNFTIKYPLSNRLILNNKIYVGDRWDIGDIDARRECYILKDLPITNMEFINFNNTILENCSVIDNCQSPFISNFTGVGILADLLKKETLIVWKAEDWKPEFRKGDDISWDNGKDINGIFAKHMYADRKCKLVHAKDLVEVLNEYSV